MSNLEDILHLVWFANQLHLGERKQVLAGYTFPADAFGAKPGDERFIQPWVLETLVNEAVCEYRPRPGKRRLDPKHFGAFIALYNPILAMENAESISDFPADKIIDAMPRLLLRQVEWQTGLFNFRTIYRTGFLYNFDDANSSVYESRGLTIPEIFNIGFQFFSLFSNNRMVFYNDTPKLHRYSGEKVKKFISATSASFADFKRHAQQIRSGKGQIAYKPSALRSYPILTRSLNNRTELFCPIPQILGSRLTSGMFYEIAGDDDLRRQASLRFEAYVEKFLLHGLNGFFEVRREFEYRVRKNRIKSPDHLLCREGALEIVVECKGRKLPYEIRRSPNPFRDLENRYQDIVNGVVQVWKFRRDSKLEEISKTWSESPCGMIVLLEPWLRGASNAAKGIIELAKKKFLQQNGAHIHHCIPISFVHIDDLESVLATYDPVNFKAGLMLSTTDKYYGYEIDSVFQAEGFKQGNPNGEFPYFDEAHDAIQWDSYG